VLPKEARPLQESRASRRNRDGMRRARSSIGRCNFFDEIDQIYRLIRGPEIHLSRASFHKLVEWPRPSSWIPFNSATTWIGPVSQCSDVPGSVMLILYNQKGMEFSSAMRCLNYNSFSLAWAWSQSLFPNLGPNRTYRGHALTAAFGTSRTSARRKTSAFGGRADL